MNLKELEDKLEEARSYLKEDPSRSLKLIREIAEESLKIAAPGWNPEEESLADYSSRRKYPDFFHDMADRIEGSWKFARQANESDVLGALSSAAFLLEVLRRLNWNIMERRK